MKKLITFLLILVYGLNLRAEQTDTLDLKQCIDLAIANKQDLRARQNDIDVAQLQTRDLKALYWPQILIAYNYQYNPIIQTSVIPVGEFNSSNPINEMRNIKMGTPWQQTAGVKMLQPLIDFSIGQRIKESKLEEAIKTTDKLRLSQSIIYEVTKTYINICIEEQQARNAILDTLRSFELYEKQKSLFRNNRLLKTDLNKAGINHNDAVQQVRNILSQWSADRIYLSYLTGRNLERFPEFKLKDISYSDIADRHLNQEPVYDSVADIKSLIVQGQRILTKRLTEKNRYLPKLQAEGYLGMNQFSNRFSPFQSNTWYGHSYLGLTVQWNILFGENLKAKLESLNQQHLSISQDLKDKKQSLTKDAFIAKIKYDNLLLELKTLTANVQMLAESLSLLKHRLEEGQINVVDLNISEFDYLQQQNKLREKQINGYLFILDYMKAAGVLNRLRE